MPWHITATDNTKLGIPRDEERERLRVRSTKEDMRKEDYSNEQSSRLYI